MNVCTKKITNKNILFSAIILLLFLTCLPITQCLPAMIRKLLQALAIGLFMFGILLEKQKLFFIEYIVCSLFCFSYVYGVWGSSQGFFTCLFNVLAGCAFCFYGIFSIEKRLCNKKYAVCILKITIALFVVTAITTIIGLEEYPLAVRELGRAGSGYTTSGEAFLELKSMYRMHNIASWSMAYGMALFVPALIAVYQKEKKVRYLILCLICELCIIKSQLTIGFILSLLGVGLVIYMPSKTRRGVILTISGVLVILVILIFLEDILLYMIKLMEDNGLTMLNDKLNDVLGLLKGEDSLNASARFDQYKKSLDTFWEHPVFGSALASVKDGMLGNHSDFFDILGYYGLFGIMTLFLMIARYFYYVKRNIKLIPWEMVALFIPFLVLMILNPVWYSPQVFVSALMIPMLIQCVFDTEN